MGYQSPPLDPGSPTEIYIDKHYKPPLKNIERYHNNEWQNKHGQYITSECSYILQIAFSDVAVVRHFKHVPSRDIFMNDIFNYIVYL